MSAPRARQADPALPREPPSPLRTLSEWATTVHQQAPSGATKKDLKRITRKAYDAMAPNPTPPAMNKRAQKAHIQALQAMHASPQVPLKIAPQSQDKLAEDKRSSPAGYLKRDSAKAVGEFAYRYRPEDARPSDPQKRSGRLTVNMNPKRSRTVATALGSLLSDPAANPNLRALKVMGPARIGQRVDDAVLYLRGHDERGAKGVASNLEKSLQGTPDALVDHGPPGMMRVARGISYAETVPGDSTSHGNARGKIVVAAVQDYRSLGGAMRHHVSYRAFRAGYNPELPSHAIAPARAELLKEIPAAVAKRKEKRIAQEALNAESMQRLGALSRGAGARAREKLLKAIPAAAERHQQRREQQAVGAQPPQRPAVQPQGNGVQGWANLMNEIEAAGRQRQAARLTSQALDTRKEMHAAVLERQGGQRNAVAAATQRANVQQDIRTAVLQRRGGAHF